MEKKVKKRVIFVILFILISAIYLYINIRGEYLQIIGIGKQYAEIFKTNLKMKLRLFVSAFLIIYIIAYITTVAIRKGLRKFYIEEKMHMPKLPNKSISFAFAVIGSIIVVNTLYEKFILCFSNVWFGQGDPIFNIDIAYYMFVFPFVNIVIKYIAIYFAILSIYTIAYYIIVINTAFKKGINFESIKNNTFVKHITFNILLVVFMISLLVLIGITNITNEGFMKTQDGTTIYGAGLVEITIKGIGYLIFSLFIIICTVSGLKKIKTGDYKKGILKFILIPVYLVVMFLLIISTEFIYLRNNEFDKEKQYIKYNIDGTKSAYNIKISEYNIENSGTINADDVINNKFVFDNVNLLSEEAVLEHLAEYNTNLGYYSFNRANAGIYNNELVYVAPREIISNNTRTYKNKTYQYTHGYDVIVASASELENTGTLKYRRNGFNKNNEFININEPRIYFGLQTHDGIITKSGEELEYDYPITSTLNVYNAYDGQAGIHLDFVDRFILGLKEGNLKLAFSAEVGEESNIILSRNILERAKKILPYIEYDPEPYLIISDNGKLVWVLDGYTVSNQYPYSQKTNIQYNEQSYRKINYIRNSVKVFIDAYDGTMEFYITDRTDPIIMAYWNRYSSIFEDLDKQIPEVYKNHLVYPKFLFNIQAKQLERYHDVQAEVLYRADDVWSISKEKESPTNKNTTTKNVLPYYVVAKTVDNSEPKLSLIIPYTINGKQNITSYLVGTDNLTLYRFDKDNMILGTTQLERLIEEDEIISKEIEALKVAGTKIEKKLYVIPVNEKLLYVEPIYQVLINESKVPLLKKVVVASGDKVAIGGNIKEALENLLSQEAVNIELDQETVEYLINEIIKANKNLEESNQSNDWTMIGKDIERLQDLIYRLEQARTRELI